MMCDRGIFDGRAYTDEKVWERILAKHGWHVDDSRSIAEERYNAILHMVSAADGAEEFYDLSNEARFETVEEARERDYALRDCYKDHHNFRIVDNGTNF